MHELSLMNGLMQKIGAVAKQEQAGKVTGVRVKLGALSHISADHFREHFARAARGTLAEGARLETDVLTDMSDPRAQEIVLESIELEYE